MEWNGKIYSLEVSGNFSLHKIHKVLKGVSMTHAALLNKCQASCFPTIMLGVLKKTIVMICFVAEGWEQSYFDEPKNLAI